MAPPGLQPSGVMFPFAIRTVFGNSVSVYFRSFRRFGALGVILLSPLLLLDWVSGGGGLDLMLGHRQGFSMGWLSVQYFVLSVILQSLLIVAVTLGLSLERQHRPARIGDCLGGVLPNAVPVVVVSIVAVLASLMAFLLVVYPGLLLLRHIEVLANAVMFGGLIAALAVALRYLFAVPLIVVERRGIFRSLGRSAFLTKGSTVKIFLVMAILPLFIFSTYFSPSPLA